MNYTLVIIDMQSIFAAANDKRVIDNCRQQIKKAIKDNAGIIFVEYFGGGKTISSLKQLVTGYKRTTTTIKRDNNGSTEIHRALKRRRFNSKNIKVCGVNTDYCVLETVEGLSYLNKIPSIKVISGSCNSFTNTGHVHGLKMMKKLNNVSVTRKK